MFVFESDGYVRKLVVKGAVFAHQLETHTHTYILLGDLGHAARTLEEECGATALAQAQVVARHIASAVEAKEVAVVIDRICDQIRKTGIPGQDAPTVHRVIVGAVATGCRNEVVGCDIYPQVLDIQAVGCHPGRSAIHAESHFGVEVVEGESDIAVACRALFVDLLVVIGDKQIVVPAVGVALNLCHHVRFGVGGHDQRAVALEHAVVAGLAAVCGGNCEVGAGCFESSDIAGTGGDGVETVGECRVVPVFLVLAFYAGVIPVIADSAIPCRAAGLVFHHIVAHHGVLGRHAERLPALHQETGGQRVGGCRFGLRITCRGAADE